MASAAWFSVFVPPQAARRRRWTDPGGPVADPAFRELMDLPCRSDVSSSFDPPLFPIATVAADRRPIPCPKPQTAMPGRASSRALAALCALATCLAHSRLSQPAHCPCPAPPLVMLGRSRLLPMPARAYAFTPLLVRLLPLACARP